MNAPSHADLIRLDRWVRVDGTPEELEALRQWIEADAGLQALATAMQTVGQGDAESPRPWDAAGRWAQMQQKICDTARTEVSARPAAAPGWRGARSARRSWWSAAAAAVLVLVGGGASWWVTQAPRTEAMAGSAMREIVTRRGERFVLELPDGSQAVVAPDSRLRIPASYQTAGGLRDIYLDRGDVFLTVKHRQDRPFRVHTTNGIVEDLGTEFLVTVSPNQNDMRVVVVSGEVAVWSEAVRRDAPQPLFTLSAGQLGALDAHGNASVLANIDPAPYVSWVDGTLIFDNARLDEVLARLSRWYDLDIRVADSSLAEQRVSATVRHQSVQGVVQSLALTLGLSVEHVGERIVLAPMP